MSKSTMIGALATLAHFEAMAASINDLSLTEQAMAVLVLRKMAKLVEKRDKALTGALIEEVKHKGHPHATDKGGTDAGHLAISMNEIEAVRQRKVATLPAEKGLRDLLKSKGIEASAAFEPVTVEQISESKVDALIKSGKVTQAEVDALKAESFALTLEPSAALKAEIEGAAKPEKQGAKKAA